MLAGVSYAAARDVLFGPGHRGASWTDKEMMVGALRKCRVIMQERWVRCVRPERLPKDALLRTNVLNNGNWHWAVWDAGRNKILDPLPYKRGFRPISALTVVRRTTHSN